LCHSRHRTESGRFSERAPCIPHRAATAIRNRSAQLEENLVDLDEGRQYASMLDTNLTAGA
jgi:hypothetical protein